MLSWLPSFDYPTPNQTGYWHPISSTINWCEEDYYATRYSAEIVNTLTNLVFIHLGIKGALSCIKYGHDRIFLVSFIGYLLVGSGSFMFHTTLKYPMQLVDELSMVYTTCIMIYASFSPRRSRFFSIWLGIGLVALSVFITLYYHYLQDPEFHQNAYAFLTVVVLLRSMYLMETRLRPSLKHTENNFELRWKGQMTLEERRAITLKHQRDLDILMKMWLLIACGLSIFLGGFGIWKLDNKYCSTLRIWRREIGLPWGILLEGHGWWHIMTGIGAYFYITWGVWLRHCLNGRQEEYRLVWPRILSIPVVVKKDAPRKTL